MRQAVALVLLISQLLLNTFHLTPAKTLFTRQEDGSILAAYGCTYIPVGVEGEVYSIGKGEHLGYVAGEPTSSYHMGIAYTTGMFRIQGDDELRVLYRLAANNEWRAYYRRADLPALDLSLENCIRFEFIPYQEMSSRGCHRDCGDGITDPAELQAFLSEITAGKTAREAGLYELLTNDQGVYDNCYVYGYVLGYFAEEPNLVVHLTVMSFHDLAYSITIDDTKYVLPEKWLAQLT